MRCQRWCSGKKKAISENALDMEKHRYLLTVAEGPPIQVLRIEVPGAKMSTTEP